MKTLLFTILSISLLLSSCSKKGCTDSDATNYSEKAKKNDGTCTYKSVVQFYWNQNCSQNLINDGTTSLKLYINDVLQGSASSEIYTVGTPDCNNAQQLGIKITYDLQKNKTQSLNYKVTAQDDFVYWQETRNFNSGCNTIELVW